MSPWLMSPWLMSHDTVSHVSILLWVRLSLILVTALSPVIGYDNAAKIAKRAHNNRTTLKYEAIKSGLISKKEYEKIVQPSKMTRPS